MIIFGPITFHLYGLFIGLALLVGLWLVERKSKALQLDGDYFWQLVTAVIILALIGARLWHVLTDWPVYQNHWGRIFFVNAGGMSIFGALAGGWLGLTTFNFWHEKLHQLLGISPVKINQTTFLDLTVFGLPLAQAIGRLGNYANEELYGLPTQSHFALYIDSAHRLPGFASQAYYQPLFLYEIIALLFLVWLIYWLSQRSKNFFRIGSGHLFLVYLLGYSLARFFLDFIRLDKAVFPGPFSWLGVNQAIVFFVALIAALSLRRAWQQNLKIER